MTHLNVSQILLVFLGTILLFSNGLIKANRSVDWDVEFETTNCEMRLMEPKEFDLTIENLRVFKYDDSVHVISSDPAIVQVSNTGFVYDFDEGRWRGVFIATPIGIGNVNISVEVKWSSHTETSSEKMAIKVHRNRITKFSFWIFDYTNNFITVVFYITIGMVLNWRKWYVVVQRPTGLFDVFCINVFIMLLVSKKS